MSDFRKGDRVWYQPSKGALFAGVVQSVDGSTASIWLSANYWKWKIGTYEYDRVSGWVSVASLSKRDERLPEFRETAR